MIAIDKPSIGEFSQDTAGSTIAVTTDHAVSPFGFIVLGVQWLVSAGQTLSSVSGGGLTWTIDFQANLNAISGIAIVSAQAPAGLAAGNLVTANLSASVGGARVLVGTSFTGVKPSAAAGAHSSLSTSATTAWSTGLIALAAGSMICAISSGLTTDGTSLVNAPSVETHDVTGGAGSYDCTTAYRIEANAGSQAVAGTFSTNQTGGALGVAYLVDPNPPSRGDPTLGMIQPIVRGRFA